MEDKRIDKAIEMAFDRIQEDDKPKTLTVGDLKPGTLYKAWPRNFPQGREYVSTQDEGPYNAIPLDAPWYPQIHEPDTPCVLLVTQELDTSSNKC